MRFKCRQNERISHERTKSGREFQIVGVAAAQKEREPKVRLVRGTYERLAEKDDLRKQ